jgi:hypothetical protein
MQHMSQSESSSVYHDRSALLDVPLRSRAGSACLYRLLALELGHKLLGFDLFELKPSSHVIVQR